jgi:DNA/RNA endonuclease YhcR with UshA esterase domain
MRSFASVVTIAVTLALLPAPARAQGAAHAVLTSTVARARGMAEGRLAKVEGIVTVASGTMDAGFALQDATGGIYVAADSGTRVHPGQRVRVEGRRASNRGLATLVPTSVRVIGAGHPPKPQRVRTAAVGEANEGRLVEIRGTAVDSASGDPPYGYRLRVDDGSGPVQVFFPASAGSFGLWRVGRGARVRIVGLSGRYGGVREVVARGAGDLRVDSGR